MKQFNIRNFNPLFGTHVLIGDGDGHFNNVATIESWDRDSLIFIGAGRKDRQLLFEEVAAAVVICLADDVFTPKESCLYVKVGNPRLVFARVLSAMYPPLRNAGIHETAIIHPEAEIHSTVHIGAFSQIGKCAIGEGSFIDSHCRIMDGTTIGRHTTILSGAVIGSDGFGYVREDDGSMFRFPHIGGVVIGDHVDIGANTCIDRGGLGMTTIGHGTKIDNLVHIAHNVKIGERCSIVACSMIGGSVVIGNDTWVGPNASVADQLHLGENASVTMGAVVTKNVAGNSKVTGNFAIDHHLFILNLKRTTSSSFIHLSSSNDNDQKPA